jgi:CheY-specific phosphatase CheX
LNRFNKKLEMNISQKFEILQKLDSLFTYSELLSGDFKTKYINDLEHLKKRFSDFKANENGHGAPSQTENTPPADDTKPVSDIFTPGFAATMQPPPVGLKLKANSQPPVEVPEETPGEKARGPVTKTKRSSFEPILEAVIPRLTDEGKKMAGDLSLPIDLYLVLKSIDDKSSVYKLFEEHFVLHGTNFINFANSMINLEQESYIFFIRTEENIVNSGLLKIEEIFSYGKVIPDDALAKALEEHKPPTGVFSGKKMIELKLIKEETLGISMRVQQWVAKLAEKSPYVEGYLLDKPGVAKEAETNLGTTLRNFKIKPALVKNNPAGAPPPPLLRPPPPLAIKEAYSKLLDYIIPVLNEKGAAILESQEHKELSARIGVIDGKSSILEIFKTNRESFSNNRFMFLKLLLKLDAQGILVYKENDKKDEGEVWIKFGELLFFLDLVTEEKFEEALNYQREKKIYIGEALVELNYLESGMVDECLKIQQWLNSILANISYESSFVDVIQSVLKESFKCIVEIGTRKKVSFSKPLKDIVYIEYGVDGKFNGRVFYISDRSFMQNLAKTMMASVGSSESDEFDESYVSAVSSVIITNSLSKLARMGLFSSSDIPKILMDKKVIMDKEVVIADHKTISLVQLINQWGRFAIGLEST